MLHVQHVDAEALLLDSIVRIDGHGVVVVVYAVLYRRRLDVELLRIVVVDDCCALLKVETVGVGADWRCCDSNRRRPVAARVHRVIVIGLGFPPALVGREESNWTRCG